MKKLYSIILIVMLSITLCAEDYKYQENISVYSKDGTKISANLFVPIDANKNIFPVIIFANSWSLDEHEYVVQAELFAKKGYIVFSYSSRGWGKSEGMINVAGEKDMEDLSACIDWVLAQTPADKENIGIGGISYGAGMSLLAAAMEPRIKTAVAMSTWGNLAESLYGNQTPRLIWGTILLGSGYLTGNMDPAIIKYYNNLVENKNVAETLAWAAKRSPITYIDKINERGVPIYISNNLQDELFQPNSVVHFFNQLTGPKLMDINLGIHASAELGGLIGVSNYVWQNAHDWFDHWLKGVNNGVTAKPNVSVCVKNSGKREFYTSWPLPKTQQEKFFLAPRGKSWEGQLKSHLTEEDIASVDVISNGIFSGISTGIPVIGAIFEAHTPFPVQAWLSTADPYLSVIYQTPKLEKELLIRGTPSLELSISADHTNFQLIGHLYDVDEWGFATLITHSPLTIRSTEKNKNVSITTNFVTTFYDIKKGHRLALAIDTYDLNYSPPNTDDYDIKFHYSEEPILNIPHINKN